MLEKKHRTRFLFFFWEKKKKRKSNLPFRGGKKKTEDDYNSRVFLVRGRGEKGRGVLIQGDRVS